MNENETQAMIILRIAGNVHDALLANNRTEAEEHACWLISALMFYGLADGIVERLAGKLELPEEQVQAALEDAAAEGTGV